MSEAGGGVPVAGGLLGRVLAENVDPVLVRVVVGEDILERGFMLWKNKSECITSDIEM